MKIKSILLIFLLTFILNCGIFAFMYNKLNEKFNIKFENFQQEYLKEYSNDYFEIMNNIIYLNGNIKDLKTKLNEDDDFLNKIMEYVKTKKKGRL